MPASFGGFAIFGQSYSFVTSDPARAEQKNAFPGLNGIESLDQGSRGRVTDVTGYLAGFTAFDLNAAENFFRSMKDGNAYDLIDTFGNVWPYVKYDSFEPQGRVRVFAGTGVYFREYKSRFVHLI